MLTRMSVHTTAIGSYANPTPSPVIITKEPVWPRVMPVAYNPVLEAREDLLDYCRDWSTFHYEATETHQRGAVVVRGDGLALLLG